MSKKTTALVIWFDCFFDERTLRDAPPRLLVFRFRLLGNLFLLQWDRSRNMESQRDLVKLAQCMEFRLGVIKTGTGNG